MTCWHLEDQNYCSHHIPLFCLSLHPTRARPCVSGTRLPTWLPCRCSYSMCMWGVGAPWEWGAAVGNSWRSDADITPTWDAVLRSLDNGAAGLARFAGPRLGWNDPDMLEVCLLCLFLCPCVWQRGRHEYHCCRR